VRYFVPGGVPSKRTHRKENEKTAAGRERCSKSKEKRGRIQPGETKGYQKTGRRAAGFKRLPLPVKKINRAKTQTVENRKEPVPKKHEWLLTPTLKKREHGTRKVQEVVNPSLGATTRETRRAGPNSRLGSPPRKRNCLLKKKKGGKKKLTSCHTHLKRRESANISW